MLNKLKMKMWLPVMFGTAMYAFGFHYFIAPNHFMDGGVAGIALLANYSMGIPPSLTTLVLNIPLFIVGFRLLGAPKMLLTILGVLSLAFFLLVMEVAIAHAWIIPLANKNDMFLYAVCGGAIGGGGLGIVFRYGGTTGGYDIVASILHQRKSWSIGRTMFVIDIFILGASLLYIPQEKILYTLVYLFVSVKLIDYVSLGARQARDFMIISREGQRIVAEIAKHLDRGATIFPAKGAYTNATQDAVYCIVSRRETAKLKNIVLAVDPAAFMIIGNLYEVHGEGFRE